MTDTIHFDDLPEDIFDHKKPCLIIDAGFITL